MSQSGAAPPVAGAGTRGWLRPVAAGIFSVAVLRVLAGLHHDLARGGNPWKQGDWLINLAAGPVRRGHVGSALLWVSDVSGLGPVTVVVLLQAVLVVLLAVLVLRAVWRHLDHPAMVALWLSPGVFALFWAGDPQGAVRKELIAFVAFALVVAAQVRAKPRLAPLLLAAAVFLIGVLGHEANALLAPAFVLVLVLGLAQRGAGKVLVLALPALVLAGTALLGAYAVRHPSVDPVALFAPLHARGLPEWFCRHGAIWWLHLSPAEARAPVQSLLTPAALTGFTLTYALASAPVLYTVACCQRRGLLSLLFLLAGLACAPLFALAVDWGRWLDFHLTSFAFVLTSLLLSGSIGPLRPARWRIALPLLVLGLLWSPEHGVGIEGPLRATPARVWLEGDSWRTLPDMQRGGRCVVPGTGAHGQGSSRSR